MKLLLHRLHSVQLKAFTFLFIITSSLLIRTVIAQTTCVDNSIYVSPGANGSGTKGSPTNLLTALGKCASDTSIHRIKMSIGAHTFSQTLYIPSNVTVEGGFDATGNLWQKSISRTTISVSPGSEEFYVKNTVGDKVLIGHFIGIRMDSIQNSILKDFDLEVHKKYSPYENVTQEGVGKSIYAIYAKKSSNVYLINLKISTDQAGEGLFGESGRNGADAYFNKPGKTAFDNSHTYRPPLTDAQLASQDFRAGGDGGNGGRVQQFVPCYGACGGGTCMPENPAPVGGSGGKGGGKGGQCGDPCAIDCYYAYYVGLVPVKDALKSLIDLPTQGMSDPHPKAGSNGSAGSSFINGSDYQDQTWMPYDDTNDGYYIPGNGAKGGDGSGGSGGGGGGAGGIRMLALPPGIPLSSDPYTKTVEALNKLNALVTYTVPGACQAEVLNKSSEGGAGGAGGEGGEGGEGGKGGGATIGFWGYLCTNIKASNCVYNLGGGGDGGIGAYGGKGGKGGKGLAGALTDNSFSFNGAFGGDGGDGGDGGRGQHGKKGYSFNAFGISTPSAPFILSDVKNACTNSIITLYSSGNGRFGSYNQNGVPLVTDLPSNPNYTVTSPSIKVYATALGILPVSFFPNTGVGIPSNVNVTIARPLPAVNIPKYVCKDATVVFSVNKHADGHVWQVYDNATNTLIGTSTDSTYSFTGSAYGTYVVWYQAYDVCCGYSTPTQNTFFVPQVVKPIVSKRGNTTPYCFGTDSTLLQVTNEVLSYGTITWTGGFKGTDVFVKNAGKYTATLTDKYSGCTAVSDELENLVYDLPTGKPTIQDIQDGCGFTGVYIQPNFEAGIRFNFYNSPISDRYSLLAEAKYNYVANPSFISNETATYYVRKVKTYYEGRNFHEVNCASAEVQPVKITREHIPPQVNPAAQRGFTVSTDSYRCAAGFSYDFPSAIDACSGPVIGLAKHIAQNNTYSLGANVDTIRYRDNYNNILDFPIYITVYDNTKPVITKLPGVSGSTINTTSGTCQAYYPFTLATATDNCSTFPALTKAGVVKSSDRGYTSLYFTNGYTKDSIFNVGINTIAQTWSDVNGNILQYEQTINVKDSEVPAFSNCKDVTFYVERGKNNVNTSYSIPPPTDNCTGSNDLNLKFVSGFGYAYQPHAIGTTVERWSATDASGNIGVCTFNLTVLDTIAPAIDCSKHYEVAAIAGTDSAKVTFALPTATDNSGTVTVTPLGKTSGSYFKLGQTFVPFKATDPSGNSKICGVIISVFDTEAPNIICPANVTVPNTNATCGAVVNFTIAPAHDNDGSNYTPVQTGGLASGAVFPIGTTLQSFSVSDAQGNKSFCSFTVTVTDLVAPVFSNCPGNKTYAMNPLQCGLVVAIPVPTATDNSCSALSTGFFSGSTGFFPVGNTHQIYKSTDIYGNSATCEFDVTITDNTTMAITCPADIDVPTSPGICGKMVEYALPKITPAYNCTTFQLVSGPASGTLVSPGPHIVAYRATALGKTASCSFNINVNDTQGPVLTRPANITKHIANGTCGAVINFTEPVATDNCTNTVTQQITGLKSGSNFPIGTTTEKYISFDALNLDSAVFTITIKDTIPPVFTPMPDITEHGNELCGKVLYMGNPVATDNSSCFKITMLSGIAPGNYFPVGTTKQVYVATDNAGNTDTLIYNATVISDDTIFTCPSSVTDVSTNQFDKVVYYDLPAKYDCPGVSVYLVSGHGSGATFPVGKNTETYRISDASGKSRTCSFNVYVLETTPPVVNCNQYTYPVHIDSCGASIVLPKPDVFDAGGIQTLYYQINGGAPVTDLNKSVFIASGIDPGITWTAVDYSSNRSSCSMSINIREDVVTRNPIRNQVVCAGQDLTLNPSVVGGPYQYNWGYYDEDKSQNVLLSTDSTYTFKNVQAADRRQYHLSVQNKCQQTVYDTEFLLTVNTSPVVTLSGVAATYCSDDKRTIPLSVSPAGGVLSGNGINGTSFAPSIAVTGVTQLSYTFYDNNLGCASTAFVSVRVSDRPTVASFIDSIYCINALPVQLDTTASTYTGAGITGSVFNAAAAQAGSHTITRTVTTYGCASSLSKKIFVNTNIPDATITTRGPYCENSDLIALKAKTAGGTWESSLLYKSADSTSYFNVNKATIDSSTQVKYTVTKLGCTSKDSALVRVNNNQYPIPYTIKGFCYTDAPVAFDVTGGKGYYGLGFTGNVFDPSAFEKEVTSLYAVTTVNNNGCKDTVWRVAAVFKPSLEKDTIQICSGADSVLVDAGTAFASVTWFDNTTSTQKWISKTGTYTVRLKDIHGCDRLDTFNVVVQGAQKIPLINDTHAQTKCFGTPLNLSVSPYSTSILWSTGAITGNINVTTPGKYLVQLIDDNNCPAKDSIVITEYAKTTGNVITDKKTYLQAVDGTAYQWYKDGVAITGATAKTFAPTENAKYYVIVKDANACFSNSDTLDIQTVTGFGDETIYSSNEYTIYPNPGNGNFTLAILAPTAYATDIKVYDLMGEVVSVLTIPASASGEEYPLNLMNLSAGVYFAHITNNGVLVMQKIVKTQ